MLSFLPRTAPAAEPLPALLQRLARGDHGALEPLYRQEAGPVYRYALALCGNASWAADATQDAFMALVQRPAAFDPARGSLGAYLAGAARHALLARWREARDEVSLDDDSGAEPPPGGQAVSPETLLVREQAGERVWAALRALPWAFREAVVLVDLQERPYADAARIAGVELNTLRTRLHRARLRLASLLAEAGEAP